MEKTMTSHERFQRMYEHREADRVPVLDSPWSQTIDRWVEEGMPTRDYVGYFDLDRVATITTDNSPRYPQQILEETDDYVIVKTAWGVTHKTWKKHGSTPEFLEAAAAMAPRTIVYISCNPATQVRDLEVLGKAGYVLTRLTPVDLFPHTPHVETVAVLNRR